MAKEVILKADKVKQRRLVTKGLGLSSMIILILLSSLYVTLGFVYNEGKFTVLLEDSNDFESGLAVYDDIANARKRKKLEALPIKRMDNISYKWISPNVDTEADGSHNGENYIAYSFYVENQGEEDLNYWYELVVDGVIKDVDEAIRVRIYRNGDATTYAKLAKDGNPEALTTPFVIDEKYNIKGQSVVAEKREALKPNEKDRFTVVIWIEGDDPECLDNLIGGAIKMHMTITDVKR